MNARLKVICILFSIAYLFAIGQYFWGHVAIDVSAGHNNAEEQSGSDAGNRDDGLGVQANAELNVTYDFGIKPVKGTDPLSTTMMNQKTGNPVNLGIGEVSAKSEILDNASGRVKVFRNIGLFFHFLIVVIFIYIPVLSFRTVRSISRNVIFDIKNIRRIRRIGYALLFGFIGMIMSEYLSTIAVREIFEFENFEIPVSFSETNTMFLLFGLAVLLFAEILKISVKMKEEQDLTV